ncbi:A disintegrin and metalloproteinase with thrombospondin motifs 3-like [Panulirus ornatus]|uniref:A disintegrin and metalloproteinase with thrombospondin motifs 3-like n=1 Tax=Panulirus ornatus TaxID=150431 RepID=UPI003A8C4C6A
MQMGVALLTATLLLLSQAEGLKVPEARARLSKDDLRFLFGEEEAPPHSLVHIRTRSREKRSSSTLTENPGYLDVIVKDEAEEEVEFELRPNYDLVSPEFLLVVRGEDGVVKERGAARPSCVYYGNAKGRPNTTAALANCDGRGFTGVIQSANYTHLVRPLRNEIRRRRRRRRKASPGGDDQTGTTSDYDVEEEDVTSDGLHVIHTKRKNAKCAVFDLQAMKAPRFLVQLSKEYRDDDNDELANEGDGTSHDVTKREANDVKQIETAVFVDDIMYDVIKDRNPGLEVVETIQDLVFTIMNGVHLLYNAPTLEVHFLITLVRLDIIKSSDKGPSKANGDIQRYLRNFCTWQHKLNDDPENVNGWESWDHALMLSGLDLWDGSPKYDSVIGLAWVAGMCHPIYSCTINEGTSFEAVYVITHEMGHNLGMSHDGSLADKNTCDTDKFLMSASTGPGKVTWSKCSNKELKEFMEQYPLDCLDDQVKGPRHLDFNKELLPGERYTKEEQCTFAEGSTFKPYVTSKGPYNAVCRELWCQNTTHAMRTHPALEGTTCAVSKFCINGKCVAKPVKAAQTPITRIPTTTTTTPTTTTTTRTPKQKSGGFLDFFRRIRNMFKRYLFLRSDLPEAVFASHWKLTNLTKCSADCGGGWRERQVACTASGGAVALSDDLCDPQSRPPLKSTCNTSPCTMSQATTTSSSSSSSSPAAATSPPYVPLLTSSSPASPSSAAPRTISFPRG